MLRLVITEFRRKDVIRTLFVFMISFLLFVYMVKLNTMYVETTIAPTAIFLMGASLLGYVLVYKDKKSGLEMMVELEGKRLEWMSVKWITGGVVLMLVTTLFILYTFVLSFFGFEYNSMFFTDALLYIVIYYFISGLMLMSLSMVITYIFSFKLSIVVILFLTILLGPLGRSILSSIYFIGSSNRLMELLYTINISQFSTQFYQTKQYGFPVESIELYKRLSLLFCSLLFLVMYYILTSKKKRKAGFFLCCIFLIGAGSNFALAQQDVFVRYMGNRTLSSRSNDDYSYYMEKSSLNEPGKFSLLSIDADIDLRKNLEVNGAFTWEIKEQINQMDFSLYHKLMIQSISLDNQELPFEQESDQVSVSLNRTYNKGEIVKLDIKYKGDTSQYFYAGERAVYLPSSFLWLPYPGKYQAMSVSKDGSLNVLPLYANYDVDYRLNILSKYDVYSNLNGNENKIAGTSDKGVTLVGGKIIKNQIGEVEVYYDPFLYFKRNNLTGNVHPLQEQIEYVNSILGTNETTHISKIFYLDDGAGGFNEGWWNYGEFHINPSFQSLEAKEDDQLMLLSQIYTNLPCMTQSPKTLDIYLLMLSYSDNERLQRDIEDIEIYELQSENNQEKERYVQILRLIAELNKNKQKREQCIANIFQQMQLEKVSTEWIIEEIKRSTP